MQYTVVISVVSCAVLAVLFRTKYLTSADAHFRQQLFVSDTFGSSPLEVDEAKMRYKLWKQSLSDGHEPRYDIDASQRLAYKLRTGTGGTGQLILQHPLRTETNRRKTDDEWLSNIGPYQPSSKLVLPPIALELIVWLDDYATIVGPRAIYGFNIFLEAATALCLVSIWEAVRQLESAFAQGPLQKTSVHRVSIGVAAAYLFNPLSMAFPVTAVPRTVVTLPLVATVAFALTKRPVLRSATPVLLAVCLYLIPLWPLALVLPIGHLLYVSKSFPEGMPVSPNTQTASNSAAEAESCQCAHCVCPDFGKILKSLVHVAKLAVATGIWLAVLHYISYKLMDDSWGYLQNTIKDVITVSDTRPNIGVFWYAFQLIFERFRTLFLVYFQGHVFIHVTALYVKMFYLPVAYAIASLATLLIFQPYPSALDYVTVVSLLLLRPWTAKRQKAFVFLVALSAFTLGLIPVMVTLWLRRDTGNANFVYFMQIINLGAAGFLVVEWIAQVLNEFKAVVSPNSKSSSLTSKDAIHTN